MLGIEGVEYHFVLCKERTGSSLLTLMMNLNEAVLAVSEETFSYYLFPKYGDVRNWSDDLIKEFFSDFLLMHKKSLELYFDDSDKVLDNLLQVENRDIGYHDMVKILQFNFFPLKEKSLVKCVVDKQIDYTFHLKTLMKRFPSSKYVILVRDPRDNVEACIRRKMGRSMSVVYQAELWNSHYREFLPYLDDDRFLMVRYEDVITDSETVLRGVCNHLGISFSPDMVNHEGVFEDLLQSKSDKLDSNFETNIRKFHKGLLSPKDKSKIGKYKDVFSVSEIRKIEASTNELAKKFGYEIPKVHEPFSIKEKCLAILANADRNWLLKLYSHIPVSLKLALKKRKANLVNE